MTAKKPTKSTQRGAMVEPAYKPSLHLDGKHAEKMMKSGGVGKKVKMVVNATMASQSMSQDYMDPKKKNHSVRLEIDSMKPHKAPTKSTPKPMPRKGK
jgi:hypothetical protein